MKNKQIMNQRNKNKGITLIALVVTIVVLLILAGITITMVFGDNGILKVAQDAGAKQEIAALRERIETIRISYWTKKKVDNSIGLDEFWNELVKADIITDKDDEDQIQGPEAGENNTEIYTVITNDGYSVEIIVDSNGNVTIGEIEKATNLTPKIRSITVTNKTKTSIAIKVLARLQGAEIKAYYKKASEVASNEPEANIEGYTEITLDNLEGTASPLTAGEEYKIKVLLKNGEEVVNVKSINETADPLILVNNITLNKTSLTLGVESKEVLTATIAPENADNKNVTWDSTDKAVATVSQNGEVTAIAVGETTITVTAQDAREESVSCQVTVIEKGAIPYSWEELNKIAEAISNKTSYDENTENISVTVDGETKTLKVGDWTRVEGKKVRILGFNHDTLTSNTAYGGRTTASGKAGISFEYVEFLGGTNAMNSTNTNSNGWGGNPFGTNASGIRKYLNGTGETIGGEAEKLASIQSYIKQVKKPYLLGNGSTTLLYSDDWLWLLSCSEIWSNGRDGQTYGDGATYGYAKAKEGEQYKYYKKLSPDGSSSNTDTSLQKKVGTSTGDWWLRSPYCNYAYHFCYVRDSRG